MSVTAAGADPKITPFLWLDTQAEEAMNFYVSTFENSKVIGVNRYGKSGPGPEGSVMTATFELDGQRFVALNGGPHFTFTPAISFAVRCETQAEVDRLWNRLLEGGGKPNRCGWLNDRYGLSWQIVPEALPHLLQDPDPTKASAVMQAMLKMDKLDVAILQQAYDSVRTPASVADPEAIYHWRRLDDRITTSGQPTEQDLAEIHALGVRHVVNLALHTHEKALPDEAASVSRLGMTYIHIPVDFQNPTNQDFDKFCAVMNQLKDVPVHVHCIANYRVSAFFYRYRRDILGMDEQQARAEMEQVWHPEGVWASFIT